MATPGQTNNAEQMRRQIDKFGQRVGFAMDGAFNRLGQRWDKAMQARTRGGTTEPGVRKPPGTPTGRRTGRLARSLFSETFGLGNRIEGKGLFFGSRTPGQYNYAQIQEEGGTIRPRNSKYLAIPLPDAYRGRSVADPPRSYRDTFVQRNPKTGKLFIIQQARGGKFNFLFLLAKQVKLQPRLGMVSTMRNVLKRHQRRELVRALEIAAEDTFGPSGGGA